MMKFSILEANMPTENGTIYTKEVLKQICDRINNHTVMGQLQQDNESMVSLSEVSHLVKNGEIRGDVLFAEINPLETPQGVILKEKYLNNMNKWNGFVEFKCKGLGIINDNVVKDYELISVDLVAINKAKKNEK